MSCIGIDHGTKKTGLSIEIEGIAFPHQIVPTSLVIESIKKIMSERKIDCFVVGSAPHLSGQKSKQQQLQSGFAQTLKQCFPNITIVLWNEGFTSQQARFELDTAGLGHITHVDDQAAAIILQDYLNHQK